MLLQAAGIILFGFGVSIIRWYAMERGRKKFEDGIDHYAVKQAEGEGEWGGGG